MQRESGKLCIFAFFKLIDPFNSYLSSKLLWHNNLKREFLRYDVLLQFQIDLYIYFKAYMMFKKTFKNILITVLSIIDVVSVERAMAAWTGVTAFFADDVTRVRDLVPVWAGCVLA